MKTVNEMIANAGALGEQFQGICAQRYYVEILAIDEVYTLSIDDTGGFATFDANYDVGVFDEPKPSDERERLFEGIYATVFEAFTALANYINADSNLVNNT